MQKSVGLKIPLHLRSSANLREHWRAKAARVKQERQVVAYTFMGVKASRTLEAAKGWLAELGKLEIDLCRWAPRELDDDNNVGAFKSVRDEVAKGLGIDDRDKRIKWHYSQAKSHEYGISIMFTAEY